MRSRNLAGQLALAAALLIAPVGTRAQDLSKYPDWKGEWSMLGGRGFDPTKEPGLAQQAPLTPEYQKILQTSLANQAAGGLGNDLVARCMPEGMPRMMLAAQPIEFVVLPGVTYVLAQRFGQLRRIYTDGRKWPDFIEPTWSGYSIGQWVDADASGRVQTLTVETRSFKGPRNFDSSGGILDVDNESVINERLSLDRSNAEVMHDQITVTDHALTRPWTVTRDYQRSRKAEWLELVCNSGETQNVFVGKEQYKVSPDGYLMPGKKDQPPPDLRYFKTK